jgi:peptide deformylase
MSRVLRRTQFGNSILRDRARRVSRQEILSPEIQELISNMHLTLAKKMSGVGLAAPQVGRPIAICVINIHATKLRPNLPKEKWVKMTMVNPEIIQFYGRKKQLYEGCLSFGDVFAKVLRYKKVRVRFTDENGRQQEKDVQDLLAHIVQHEVDHLNGRLFVDKVKDTTTWITGVEYRKMVRNKLAQERAS